MPLLDYLLSIITKIRLRHYDSSRDIVAFDAATMLPPCFFCRCRLRRLIAFALPPSSLITRYFFLL